MENLPELPLTPAEVAKAYGLSYQQVIIEIRSGRLNAHHKKGQSHKWYITRKDLEEWVNVGMWE